MSTVLHINGKAVTLDDVTRSGSEISFTMGGTRYRFTGKALDSGGFRLDEALTDGAWQRTQGTVWHAGPGAKRILLGACESIVSEKSATVGTSDSFQSLSPVAPMPGMVRTLLVRKGDKVVSGQALLVFEAMKLQLTLSAGGDGTVKDVRVREGEMVPEGTELVILTPSKG